MKKTTISLALMLLSNSGLILFPVNPLKSENVIALDSPKVEIFDAWWDKKGKDCKVKFISATNQNPAQLQVDEGTPITKEQILQVERKVESKTFWNTYTYHIIYKGNNSAVSEARILFRHAATSRRFQKALEDFGIN